MPAVIVAFALIVTLARAQVTVKNPDGTYACPIPNGTYCAGESLATILIFRCSNGIGYLSNCDSDLAGQPPPGDSLSPCYQTSRSSGDAACSKNGIVYSPNGTFPLPVNSSGILTTTRAASTPKASSAATESSVTSTMAFPSTSPSVVITTASAVASLLGTQTPKSTVLSPTTMSSQPPTPPALGGEVLAQSDGSLGAGAKAGIGVGAALIPIALGALLVWYLRQQKRPQGQDITSGFPQPEANSPSELDGNERFEIGKGVPIDGTRPELGPSPQIPHELEGSSLVASSLHTGPQQRSPLGTELTSPWASDRGSSWFNLQQNGAPEIDLELARLREEERRIDAAIAESERIRALRLERAELQRRIMERRQQIESVELPG